MLLNEIVRWSLAVILGSAALVFVLHWLTGA